MGGTMAHARANKGHGMNPYQPPDDESQLDRIERKIDRLDGSYLLTLAIGALLVVYLYLAVEAVSARWKF
jgi:hypothetical protein